MDNNYIEKLVTQKLSQTTYGFSNIWGSWHVSRHHTWFSNINQSIF